MTDDQLMDALKNDSSLANAFALRGYLQHKIFKNLVYLNNFTYAASGIDPKDLQMKDVNDGCIRWYTRFAELQPAFQAQVEHRQGNPDYKFSDGAHAIWACAFWEQCIDFFLSEPHHKGYIESHMRQRKPLYIYLLAKHLNEAGKWDKWAMHYVPNMMHIFYNRNDLVMWGCMRFIFPLGVSLTAANAKVTMIRINGNMTRPVDIFVQ